MSNVSLTANILTSKVITGNADRLQTYRIQDSDAMMCPVWNGQDLTGRQAGEYSFYTKRAGCNSAMDRIVVENFLRPSYTNFVTTNAAGIAGYVYEAPAGNNFQKAEDMAASNQRMAAGRSTGHFGYGSPANGPYLPTNMQQELAGVVGSAQGYAIGAQQRHYTQAAATGFHLKNLTNTPQRVLHGVTWSPNPNASYFGVGPSRSSSYVSEGLYKPCA